ncbi:MAG TPA: HAD-IB family hydrolase [Steroidobacteraceae bacterium]|nr:HAD-IB family hydrolase [Steroidobacteraceae bacterium]
MFDLDGTITRSDTLRGYLTGFLRRHPARLVRLPQGLAALARFALDADHGRLKAAWIDAVLGGCTRSELAEWTASFVPELLQHGLHRDALTAIAVHHEAGDHLVLLSASPDLYVPAIGAALRFAQTVCTELEWRADRLTGRLTTANRRGAEKVRCVAALRAEHPQLPIVAYGNAASDLAYLALADRGVLVNGSPLTRRAAAGSGIACVTWR